MIAHVVPLRRLDPGHDWFDYEVPAELSIQPGSLVEIQFQSRLIRGVIWDLSETSAHNTLKKIQRVVLSRPIMTEWQRQACSVVAKLHAVSVASIVNSVVPPEWPAKVIQSFTDVTTSKPSPIDPFTPELLWYHDRTVAESWITNWLAQPGLRTVLVPTIEDGQRLMDLSSSAESKPTLITSQLTPAQYRTLYGQVLTGAVTHLIGTSRALLLPYPHAPSWLQDQVEHPSHKLRQQYPPLSITAAVERIGGSVSRTTPAPPIQVYATQKPTPPTSQPIHQLWSLGQRRPEAWITPELADLIEGSNQAPIALIVPARGFASAVLCRDCGWPVGCPTCGQSASLSKADQQHARCVVCQTLVTFPTMCPNCQGIHWHYVGLGLNRLVDALHRLWPNHSISTSWPPVSDAAVLVGTYQAYRWLGGQSRLSALVVISGDALRAWPDFSADERAWQYLARLGASHSNLPLMVQTHHPDDPFWQRWLHHDHAAWYAHELHTRKQLKLPPSATLWIAEHPTGDHAPAEAHLKKALSSRPAIQILELPRRGPTTKIRLALSGPPTAFQGLDPIELFPRPWRVDTTADSWIQ